MVVAFYFIFLVFSGNRFLNDGNSIQCHEIEYKIKSKENQTIKIKQRNEKKFQTEYFGKKIKIPSEKKKNFEKKKKLKVLIELS